MKFIYTLATAAATLALAGCERNNDQTNAGGQSAAPTTSVSARDLGKEAQQALDSATKAVAEGKDAFVTSVQTKLQEMDGQIGELEKKAEALTSEAKSDADKAVAAVKEKRGALAEKIEQAKTSSAAAWNDTKAALETALADLEKAYQEAKSKLK
jgi:hypothetical protein